MTQVVSYLIVLVALLALLNVGSLGLWRTLKFATRPVPKESDRRVSVVIIGAGLTACLVILTAACLLYQLAMHCLVAAV